MNTINGILREAVGESDVSRENIARAAHMSLDTLRGVLAGDIKTSCQSIGTILAASGNVFTIEVSPPTLAGIVLPQQKTPKPSRRPGPPSGRKSSYDLLAETEEGLARLRGAEFSISIEDLATRLIEYLYKNGGHERKNFMENHPRFRSIFENDIDATVEDVEHLLELAHGSLTLRYASI